MPTAHRLHHDLYGGGKLLTDPGDGETIRTDEDLQICEMVSGVSDESRTLAAPTKQGIRLVLRLLTDGGGNIVVYAAEGFNEAQDRLYATFADASDMLSMISVSTSTGFRWEPLDGNVGAVALA